jgi:peroxiredoxin
MTLRSRAITLFALLVSQAPLSAKEIAIGQHVGEFSLADSQGVRHSLSDWADKKAVVVVFLGAECPIAKLYGPRLEELSHEYASKGVQVVGINSNRQDTLQKIAHYEQMHKITFPILKDPDHRVADLFGADRTPVAFILDEHGIVRYSGRIDDQYGVGFARNEIRNNYLASALDELLSGRPVTTALTKAVGCYIARSERKAPQGDITYTKDISRVIQTHCLRCHRTGQIGPFSLASYEDVSAWAETMMEVMDAGRMPPWHANPSYGEFANDAHMPSAQKELFRRWMQNGMPQGDPADLPSPVHFAEDWQIGKPDIVYRMPVAYSIPAKGTVPYQYFNVEADFKDDVWVKGAEVRPGNRSVVHHAFVFFLPPGQKKPRAEDPLFNAIAGYAPGMPAGLWPEGHARLIPAGSRLVFQMHYTANGHIESDRSEVGLVLANAKEVTKHVQFTIAVNIDFGIPPGAADFHVPAGYTFTQDMLLHVLTPHMHYRGKSFRFTAEYPDGRKEILLDVPRYDFNWQNAYVLKHEKLMPKGTTVVCDGGFDNSAENPANPDPTKEVRWGDQTWNEMMLGSMVISLPKSAIRGEFPKVVHVKGNQFDVTFQYKPGPEHKDVRKVYLAGSFNGWKQTGHLLAGPDEHGSYRTTIRLKPGIYEYKFVLNGDTWTHDPGNPDQNGPFTNSVVRVRQADAK